MHLATKRILVVDDEPDTCNLIVDVLTKEGYAVYSYQNGEQARNALTQGWFDLVLADIKMPRVSGIQLLLHVKESYLDTKVILMTAFASLETAIQAVRGGAFDYLVKPFALDDLRQCVRDALLDEVDTEQMLRYRDLYLDLDARRVLLGQCEVALTRQEFEVLACLFEQPRCIVAWEELLRRVWGIREPTKKDLGLLRSCIRRLRRKLGDDANSPRYIINKWGEGYQLGQ